MGKDEEKPFSTMIRRRVTDAPGISINQPDSSNLSGEPRPLFLPLVTARKVFREKPVQ